MMIQQPSKPFVARWRGFYCDHVYPHTRHRDATEPTSERLVGESRRMETQCSLNVLYFLSMFTGRSPRSGLPTR